MTLFELSKDQVRELREDLAYGHHIPFITDPNDVTDEMLVEMYNGTEFSNDDFMAKPREYDCSYETAIGCEETECCANCGREVTLHWDIQWDGFKAYCPYCGAELLLCDACKHRFGNFSEEWQDCRNCLFKETGFAKDDVYDWGDLKC